jgi:sulfite exporter TauE/SafE
MTYYLMFFAAGFAGSFHCIGMCGGFACALGHDPRGSTATGLRHLIYNAGRLTSYVFLGGLAGAIGQAICTSQDLTVPVIGGGLDLGQRVLAMLAGLLMIAMALQFFGRLPILHRITIGFSGSGFANTLRSLLTQRGSAAPLAFGVFNGFLPCPLVYAFVAQAAGTGTALSGVLVMAAFGLGTFPAMLMMGGVGRVLAPAWRQRGVWLAGAGILLLGLITLGRGVLPASMSMGHPA